MALFIQLVWYVLKQLLFTSVLVNSGGYLSTLPLGRYPPLITEMEVNNG